MGRFYRPSKGEQINYMQQLPVDMMMRAVANTDAANDEIYAQTDMLGNALAKVNHLVGDTERVAEIQKSYNDKIHQATQALMEDPTQFRKQMPLVRNLSREISNDMTTGELAAIQGNASRMAEWDKTYKPLIGAKDGISPEAYSSMRGAFLKGFDGTKYDAATGAYKQIETEDVYRTQDFEKLIRDNTEKIKANLVKTGTTDSNGRYIYKNTSTNESVTEDRILQLAMDSIKGDTNAMGALRQGGKYGYIKGVLDQNGNFIEPYSRDTKGRVLFNDNSFLTPLLRGAVGRDAFSKTESDRDMKVDSYGTQAVGFAQDVEKMKIQDAIHDQNFTHESAVKAQYDKQGVQIRALMQGKLLDKKAGIAAKAAQLKGSAAKPANVSKAKPNDPAPQLVASPDGDITYSPFGGAKALSLGNMRQSVQAGQTDVAKLLALSKDPNIPENQRAIYNQRANEARALVEKNFDLLSKANQVGNAKLKQAGYTDTEIKLFNEKYPTVEKNLTDQIDNLRKSVSAVPGSGFGGTSIPLSKDFNQNIARLDQLQKTLDRYKQGHKMLIEESDGYLKKNSELSQIRIDGVGLKPDEKTLLLTAYKANPNAFLVRDPGNDNEDNDAVQKALRNGGSVSFERINAPAPGLGVTAVVKVKDKDGETDDKERLITIPSSLTSSLGLSLSIRNSEGSRNIGATISDSFKSEFLSSIKNKVRDVVSGSKTQPAGYFDYFDPGTKTSTTIKVVPASDRLDPNGQPVAYKAYFKNPKGEYSPLQLGPDKRSEFQNEEALAEAFSKEIGH